VTGANLPSGTGGKEIRLGAQHARLKVLEGTIARVSPEGGSKHPMQAGILLDRTKHPVRLRQGCCVVNLRGLIRQCNEWHSRLIATRWMNDLILRF
jgi:ATP-dependent protease Clp ATPase subunit